MTRKSPTFATPRYKYRPPVDQAPRGGKTRSNVSAQTMALLTQLRQARLDAGMKQSELAALVGVNGTKISDIEAGRAEPSIGRVLAIAKALGIAHLDVP